MATLVSIIIPTYNRAFEIQRAIHSALSQTHQPCEVIVVDDGSTDDTPALLAQYDSRVVIIRQNNQGRSAARNTGLKSAKGEYVVFLDSDDALLPQMVATQLDYLMAHPAAAFVHGQAWMTDARGRQLSPPVLMGAPFDRTRPAFVNLVMGQPLLIHTVLIRRAALEEVGDFDLQLNSCEDWDLWLRLAAQSEAGYTSGAIALCASDPAGHVERLARYNTQHQTPQVIARAFTYLPPDSPLQALRPRAVARALVQWGGCVEFALGHPAQGETYLRRAQGEHPELLSDMEVIPRGVAQFATWYQVDGAAFIRRFFGQLPAEFVAWRALQAPTLTLYYAKRAQLIWQQRRYASAAGLLLAAGLMNPAALGWAVAQFWRRWRK